MMLYVHSSIIFLHWLSWNHFIFPRLRECFPFPHTDMHWINENWFHVIKKHFQFNTHSLFQNKKEHLYNFCIYFLSLSCFLLKCRMWNRNRFHSFKSSERALLWKKYRSLHYHDSFPLLRAVKISVCSQLISFSSLSFF